MTVRCAALAVAATLGVPASAFAAELTVDQGCYAEKRGAITVTGAGFTPGSETSLVLGAATTTATPDDTGAFTATFTPPPTELEHPGARQFTLTGTDAAGVAANTLVNIVKPGADGVPATSRPHQRIMWNIAGFPSASKAIYGHWRFHGKTRANHRMGVPQGPCGVLHVRARQIEAKRIRFGIWLVQFDLNRTFERFAVPRATRGIKVSKTFSRARA
jgi:hypothetical protein